MNYFPHKLLLIALLLLLKSAAAVALEVDRDFYYLSDQFGFLVDNGGELTLEQILASPDKHSFTDSRQKKPDPEINGKPIWLKLSLNFSADYSGKRFILDSRVNQYSDIRIYRHNARGEYSEFITGRNYPASQRELASPRYAFYIDPSIQSQTIYIRVIGRVNTHRLSWSLNERDLYSAYDQSYWVLNLLSIGALFGIMLFSAGIGLTLRHKSYLYYSCFLLAGTLSLMDLDGLAFFLLWPRFPAFNGFVTEFFVLGVSLSRMLVTVHFLDIKKLSMRLYQWSKAWSGILLILLLFSLTSGLRPISEYLTGVIWLVTTLFSSCICLYALSRKVPLALPILFILLMPASGSIAQGMVELGLISDGVFTSQLAKMAFVLHALLFSICLSLQIRRERDGRIDAQHDVITGLPGLALATEDYDRAVVLARRYGWKLGVLFIDLDEFKKVNDTHGHQMGNKLLVEVSRRLTDCVREVDTAARIGGDEFLVLQTEIKSDAAVTVVAQRIVAAMAKPFEIDGHNICIGASIGISLYPDQSEDLNELLKAADNAMYNIKKSGKNNYSVHQSRACTEFPVAAVDT